MLATYRMDESIVSSNETVLIKDLFDRGLSALGRAELEAAEAAFRRCLELAPGNTDAWCYLGMALAPKEYARAAEALDRALALDPNHNGALYWRAEVYWLEGNSRAAAGILRHLNDIVPDSSQNLARMGLAYLSAGDTESAMSALRQAVDAGGGLASVGACQSELRRAIYLDLLGRCEEAAHLVHSVNSAGPAVGLSPARYPRDLEDQRSALENIVAGRDIVILGSGPSLAQLQPLLTELGPRAYGDFCFFGFNNLPVAERLLQDAIGRGVDLACMTSAAVMDLHASWIEDFLGRNSAPNLFLTLADALSPGNDRRKLIAERPQKLFYFASSGDWPPIPEDPLHFPPINTLMCVLPLAVLGQPRRIFLFGCDGAAPLAIENDAPVYFRQGSAEYGEQPTPPASAYAKWLARDTFFFNALIPTVLRCLSVLHRVPVPPIYICNPDSAYRSFPRISGQEFMRLAENTADMGRIFPAQISQMQRRLDKLAASLDVQTHGMDEMQQHVGILCRQMDTIKRCTGPLRALRRLFWRRP